MKSSDVITAVVLLVAGTAILVTVVSSYPVGTGRAPGSGFFPLIISFLILGLSLNLLLHSAAAVRRGGGNEDHPFFPEKDSFQRVLIAVGSLVAFRIFLPVVGFSFAVFAFCLILARLLGGYTLKAGIFFALVASVVFYYVFKVWLMVQVPSTSSISWAPAGPSAVFAPGQAWQPARPISAGWSTMSPATSSRPARSSTGAGTSPARPST